MDGLPEALPTRLGSDRQRTLGAAIGCVGVGVHSGRRVAVTLRPAPPGHGIVFRRIDFGAEIRAHYDLVADTRLCTVLADPARPDLRVGTVEHILSAAAGAGIDNLLIELDGPELPIFDGSAAPFVFLFDCAGVVEQDAPCAAVQVLRTVRVEDGDAYAELRPSPFRLELAISIEFAAAAIGRQALLIDLTPENYRREVAKARTFAQLADIAQLQAAGFARGGHLGNAIVVDGARVLNPGGLRMPDEFVRHKLLDAVGDLALAGARLRGRLVAHRPGHALNNRLLRALFADPDAWCYRAPDSLLTMRELAAA